MLESAQTAAHGSYRHVDFHRAVLRSRHTCAEGARALGGRGMMPCLTSEPWTPPRSMASMLLTKTCTARCQVVDRYSHDGRDQIPKWV